MIEDEHGLQFPNAHAEARYRAIVREVQLEAESLTTAEATQQRAELVLSAVRRARLLLEWAAAPVPDLVRSALAEAAANELLEAIYQTGSDDETART